MKQRNRRLAFVFGGTLLATLAALAACSTDNGTTPTPGTNTPDAGKKDAKGETQDGGDDDDDTDGGKKPADGGADCSAVPKPRTGDGPYCFSVKTDDGGTANTNCNAGDHEVCCSGGRDVKGDFIDSECKVATVAAEGYNTTCSAPALGDGGNEIHCTQADHCPNASETCCAIPVEGSTLKPGTNDDFPGCTAYYQSPRFLGGTRCKDGCAAGELKLCTKDADCAGVGKCVSLKLSGRDVGYCRL